MTGWSIAAGGIRQVEPPVEAGQHRAGREEFSSRCCELDGKRQSVEAVADFDDCVGLIVADNKVGAHGSHAIEKQGGSRKRLEVGGRIVGPKRGKRQRQNRVFVLTRRVLAARGW